jgi:hypothetical protein
VQSLGERQYGRDCGYTSSHARTVQALHIVQLFIAFNIDVREAVYSAIKQRYVKPEPRQTDK